MSTDSINRWLTLGANFGVLIGIFLLVAELNQNSHLMQAQIFNERSSQGIDLFMSIAVSDKLSEIDAVLEESGFPDDPSALSELTPAQKYRYLWFMRANRFRIENLLYQQTLGLMKYDRGPVALILRRFDISIMSRKRRIGAPCDLGVANNGGYSGESGAKGIVE